MRLGWRQAPRLKGNGVGARLGKAMIFATSARTRATISSQLLISALSAAQACRIVSARQAHAEPPKRRAANLALIHALVRIRERLGWLGIGFDPHISFCVVSFYIRKKFANQGVFHNGLRFSTAMILKQYDAGTVQGSPRAAELESG